MKPMKYFNIFNFINLVQNSSFYASIKPFLHFNFNILYLEGIQSTLNIKIKTKLKKQCKFLR